MARGGGGSHLPRDSEKYMTLAFSMNTSRLVFLVSRFNVSTEKLK